MEWAAIGVLAGLTVAGVTVVSFWMRFAERIATAEAAGNEAKREADAAKLSASEANEKVTIQAAAFALYREQVARDYIHREAMREVEDRLTAAIDRLGDRLDRFVEAAARK